MKKLLFLAAAVVAGIGATAQTDLNGAVKVNAETYSFGKIKQNAPVTTFFTITNTSNKPLVIESATAGCGCTTPEYSKEPIAAGASTKLKVGYNAAAMGAFTKEVTIRFAGYTSDKKVVITGEVVAPEAAAATPPQSSPTVQPLGAVKASDVKASTNKSKTPVKGS